MTKAEASTRGIAVIQERARLLGELRTAPHKDVALERCRELLVSAEPALHTVRVGQLVRACYSVGEKWANHILSVARVDGHRRVGNLTPGEIDRLLGALS